MTVRPDLIVGVVVRMTCVSCDGRGHVKAWDRREAVTCGTCVGRGERDMSISLKQFKFLLDKMEEMK